MTFLSDEAIESFRPSLFSASKDEAFDEFVRETFRTDLRAIEAIMPEAYYLDRLASAIYYRMPRLKALNRNLSHMTVLELGCGRGLKAIPWSRLFRQYHGIDLDGESIALGRRLVAAAKRPNVELLQANVAEVLKRPQSFGIEGKIDCVIMYAVLEHLTLSERRFVLSALKEALGDGGLLIISETPNRLIRHDSHSTFLHFFQSLPTELALAYIDRSSRGDARDVASAAGDRTEALYRFGMGASFHEFELDLAGPDGRLPTIVSDGWSTWPVADEPIRRDEVELAAYFELHGRLAHPAFARYWLELVFDFSAPKQRDALDPQFLHPAMDGATSTVARPSCWTLDLAVAEAGGALRYDLSGSRLRFIQIDLGTTVGAFGLYDESGALRAEYNPLVLRQAQYKRWHERVVLDLSGSAYGNAMTVKPIGAGSRIAVECVVAEAASQSKT